MWPNAFRPTSQQLVCVPGPHPRHFARSTVSLHSFLPQAALEVPEVAIRKSRQTKQDQPCINKHTHTLASNCCFTKSSNLHSTIALCTKISWRKHPILFPLGPVGFDKWTLDPKRCTYWTWILLHVVQLVPGSYRGAWMHGRALWANLPRCTSHWSTDPLYQISLVALGLTFKHWNCSLWLQR